MAYQSEIELRVKVVAKEIDDLENRIKRIKSPKILESAAIKRAGLFVEKNRLELAQRLNVERVKDLNNRTSWLKVLKEGAAVQKQLAENTKKEAAASAKVVRGRVGQAVGGALISGAFPLLTGGGGLEAGLGAAGGALGALFGPGGAFAGGIAGSALGRILQDSEDLNKSLAALNARLGAVGTTAAITASDVDTLAKKLNATKEEALDLASSFVAVTDAATLKELSEAFGPVGGAKTFELIAQASTDEKSALQAIDQLRGQIGIKAAEQLQDVLRTQGAQAASALLLDTVLSKSKEITTETQKQVGFWDRIQAAIFTAASGQIITPEQLVADRAQPIAIDQDTVREALDRYETYIKGREALDKKYSLNRKRASAKPPESQELRFQQQIKQELIKQFDIETKSKQLSVNRLERLRIEAKRIETRQVQQLELLQLQRNQALAQSKFAGDAAIINRLYDERVKTLKEQNTYAIRQNALQQDALRIEQERQNLRNTASLEETRLQLSSQLQAAQSFGLGEGAQLILTQESRKITEIQRINTLIEEQKILQSSLDRTVSEKATRQITALQAEKQLYEELLPQIAAAEKQQLLYNQALGYAQPAVNNLFTGLQEVVAGTKSAEEAFADFLNTIANQLVQTAAQMIAQYIALGIARSFAFGGGGGATAPSGDIFAAIAARGGLRANGGPVSGGTPYIVGERGPELFVPRTSGTIVPNDKMGGGVTVGSINISVENSGDSLSPAAQKQIAGQVQGIVLSTLANERRSGGML